MPEQKPEWDKEIRRRLEAAGLPPEDEAEVTEELTQHLHDRYEELRSEGAAHEAAYHVALTELNDSRMLTSELRKARPVMTSAAVPLGATSRSGIFSSIGQDLRYAIRMLRKSPGLTLVIVLTLGLGLGANTAVFTILNTLFLHPLPVKNVSALVAVGTRTISKPEQSDAMEGSSYLNYKDFQSRNQVFSSLAAYTPVMSMSMWNGAGPERLFTEVVSGNYFDTIGLKPAHGRFFLASEDRVPGADPVMVISYGAWQRRFGGAADIVGHTIRVHDVVFTIVGVGPEGFTGLDGIFGPDAWVPTMMAEQVLPAELRNALHERSGNIFRMTGRLKPGVSMQQASANLQTIAAALAQEYPEANQGRTVTLEPLTATLLGSMQRSAVFGGAVLMAIAGLILLIACSNVGNLLLARVAARRQEIAIRVALGASRGRLIRQLLTESVLLGLFSAVAGLGLGYAALRFLWSLLPADKVENFLQPRFDWSVFLFTLVAAVLAGMLFGIVPSLRSSSAPVTDVLKEESGNASRGRRRISFSNALLVGQVAFSLVALITAALFLRSIERAYRIDPGFQTQHLAIFLTNIGQAGYTQAHGEQFYREARERVETLPGVASASWASNLPLWGRSSSGLLIEGEGARKKSDVITAVLNTVDLGYFSTMGIPVLQGRVFNDDDRADTTPVAIINQTMASRYWPNQDPLGKRFQLPGEKVYRQVVGVAKNATYQSLGEDPQSSVYIPLKQSYSDAMVLYVRSQGDPAAILNPVQQQIGGIDPQLPVDDVRTGRVLIDQALWGARIGVGLLSAFGLLGLALACVGLYGVIAYSVNQRRRELGVRIALGANRSRVLRLVLGQGMTLVVLGVGLGLVASLGIDRLLTRMLYGVAAADPLSLAGASFVLLIVAAFACYLPAWRASRVNPLVALRQN